MSTTVVTASFEHEIQGFENVLNILMNHAIVFDSMNSKTQSNINVITLMYMAAIAKMENVQNVELRLLCQSFGIFIIFIFMTDYKNTAPTKLENARPR